jgi:hypothetical protein
VKKSFTETRTRRRKQKQSNAQKEKKIRKRKKKQLWRRCCKQKRMVTLAGSLIVLYSEGHKNLKIFWEKNFFNSAAQLADQNNAERDLSR